ncbi:MAG TPA: choice-of-anchor V domain-containing protein [Blastocatellia bacterium]|nr:choice-of-anchor V domain-containing protein [Blastocatellia bacterium]
MAKKRQIKTIFLALFLAAGITILLTDDTAMQTARAFSSGPPSSHTGAPGELTCAQCHTSSPNSGPGQLTIIAPEIYEPGETYQIRVQHSTPDNSRRRWGFQLTALTGNHLRVGDLRSTNGATQTVEGDVSGATRKYIEHSSQGTFSGTTGGATWTFEWTAPETDVGGIIFYAAGNQANGNGASSGDQIYVTAKAVLSGPPEITSARVEGKRLIVTGRNFDLGAELLVNDVKQKKTTNDAGNLTSSLTSKKAGKKLPAGVEVMLKVRNPDGAESEPFPFTK